MNHTNARQNLVFGLKAGFCYNEDNSISFLSLELLPSDSVRRPSSVVRRQQFDLNDISSETAGPRALIFGILHCLEDFYQICSNGGPGVRNGPMVERGSWVQK